MPSISAAAVATPAAKFAVDAFQQAGIVLEDTRVAIERPDDGEADGPNIAPCLPRLRMAAKELFAELGHGGVGTPAVFGGFASIGGRGSISAATIVAKLAGHVADLFEDPAEVRITGQAVLTLGHGHNVSSATTSVNVARPIRR